MSDFFDSSWLIGALVEDEPDHELCLKKIEETMNAGSALAAQHSLAEVFHTITGKKGVPPEQAAELLRHNFADIRWLPLDESDYWHCVDSAHRRGARGGAIFDMLLLQAAEKENAKKIHTLNKRHFLALAPQLRDRITGPED